MTDVKKFEKTIDHWVEIDMDLCTGNGKCANDCPVGVYEVVDGKVKIDNLEDCIKCGDCQFACPNHAILRHWAWHK
jgi:2-oxoglutarate ferredoxin oxidoreductase subunit delta